MHIPKLDEILYTAYLIVILLFSFANSSHAAIDSLKYVWLNESIPDSIRFKAINEFHKENINAEPTSVLRVVDYHYKLALKTNSNIEIVNAINSKVAALKSLGQYGFLLNLNQLYSQSSASDFTLLLDEIEDFWNSKLPCDSLSNNYDWMFEQNGQCDIFNDRLSGYLFDDLLYVNKEKIRSLIELRADCAFFIKRTHSTNYDRALLFRLKNLYYSIDYIGLKESEKIEKLVSVLPGIIDTYRFGAIALNFERTLVFDNIKFVSIDYLVQINNDAAKFISDQVVWGKNFPQFSNFEIDDKAYSDILKALERN